jgi:hypothetical protein
LNNAGILTDKEREELEKELDSAKKSSMEADVRHIKRKMVFILIGSIVLITAVVIYIKVKKRS